MKLFKTAVLCVLTAAVLLSLAACGGGSTAQQSTASPDDETIREIKLTGSGAEFTCGGVSADGGIISIKAAGHYSFSGTLDDGQIIVNTGDDKQKVTITLDNADITCLTGPAISVERADKVKLELADGSVNTVVSGTEETAAAFTDANKGAVIDADDDLTIKGSGTLNVIGYINNGISCSNDLEIKSGVIVVSAVYNGIKGTESVTIEGGNISVSAGNDGIKTAAAEKQGKGNVELSGGSIAVHSKRDGISAAADVLISGGELDVRAAADSKDDGCKGIKAAGRVEISGGNVCLNTEDQGIRAINIIISGGETVIFSEKKCLKADNGCELSGGTLFAAADTKSLPELSGSQPFTSVLKSFSKGSEICVSGAGGTLFSINAKQSCKAVLFSSAEMSGSAEYSIG